MIKEYRPFERYSFFSFLQNSNYNPLYETKELSHCNSSLVLIVVISEISFEMLTAHPALQLPPLPAVPLQPEHCYLPPSCRQERP